MNKLVRDNIPAIIGRTGKRALVSTLEESAYHKALCDKLGEEVEEFLQSGEVMELCDVVEVVHALLAVMDISMEEFERLRLQKRHSNGGFERRLLLTGIEDA